MYTSSASQYVLCNSLSLKICESWDNEALEHACGTIYWPKLTRDITAFSERCGGNSLEDSILADEREVKEAYFWFCEIIYMSEYAQNSRSRCKLYLILTQTPSRNCVWWGLRFWIFEPNVDWGHKILIRIISLRIKLHFEMKSPERIFWKHID